MILCHLDSIACRNRPSAVRFRMARLLISFNTAGLMVRFLLSRHIASFQLDIRGLRPGASDCVQKFSTFLRVEFAARYLLLHFGKLLFYRACVVVLALGLVVDALQKPSE